ncbi:MAG TPA: outer membrane beta-barrel protein [Flavisolibacter sp.]|nr:outer membrane beta-barrel protein [Flavisolibacter sp.]
MVLQAIRTRVFTILCIFILSFETNAQVQFACFAGGQATSARYLVDGAKQPNRYKPGTMGGVAVKVEFDNQLYFFPAVFYNLKGYKVTLNHPAFPPSELAKGVDLTVHTIEVAPLLHFDFNKKASHFFVRFGPSVDYGYYGTESVDTVSSSGARATVYRRMRFDFTEYGHFTAQANLHFGYETGKGLMMFAFYQRGFGSMNNHDGGPKIFHRIIGISAGWLFGRNPLVTDTRSIKN